MSSKQELIEHLIAELSSKAEVLSGIIIAAKESRNDDTKSSAGDKFETGREMIQAEINKNEIQLSKTNKLIDDLKKINPHSIQKTASFGSIVFTNIGSYFLSIAMGKTTINGIHYFVISLPSPIGQALYNKQIGDVIEFNGNRIEIIDIQ